MSSESSNNSSSSSILSKKDRAIKKLAETTAILNPDLPLGSIYIFTHKRNGKMYIGQTRRELKIRINDHLYDSQALNVQPKSKFHKAVNDEKNRWDSFTFQSDQFPVEILDIVETQLIALYKTQEYEFGYNVSAGGNNGTYSQYAREMSSKSRGGKICNIRELKDDDGKVVGYCAERIENGKTYYAQFTSPKLTLEEKLEKAKEHLEKIKNKDPEVMNRKLYNKLSDLPTNICYTKHKGEISGYLFRYNVEGYKHSKTFADRQEPMEEKYKKAIQYKEQYLKSIQYT